jgi:hypothetical protein
MPNYVTVFWLAFVNVAALTSLVASSRTGRVLLNLGDFRRSDHPYIFYTVQTLTVLVQVIANIVLTTRLFA